MNNKFYVGEPINFKSMKEQKNVRTKMKCTQEYFMTERIGTPSRKFFLGKGQAGTEFQDFFLASVQPIPPSPTEFCVTVRSGPYLLTKNN
jgi:hypothetical protein